MIVIIEIWDIKSELNVEALSVWKHTACVLLFGTRTLSGTRDNLNKARVY